MKRKIIETSDGSKTLLVEDWDESYHSKHGAIQEAVHVFINQGLQSVKETSKSIKILEIGYGTGLNCLLTFLFSKEFSVSVEYVGIEKFPISKEEFEALNYANELKDRFSNFDVSYFEQKLFDSKWEESILIDDNFKLKKVELDFFDLENLEDYDFDLIYFDAFGSRAQPELWEEKLLKLVIDKMNSPSLFVTYAAKGSLKRTLKQYDIEVEKLPGPPGKREMMRGKKS